MLLQLSNSNKNINDQSTKSNISYRKESKFFKYFNFKNNPINWYNSYLSESEIQNRIIAQDISITKHYCGAKSKDSISLSEVIDGGNIIVSLSDRVLGRSAAEDIKHPITGDILVKKRELIDEELCEKNPKHA